MPTHNKNNNTGTPVENTRAKTGEIWTVNTIAGGGKTFSATKYVAKKTAKKLRFIIAQPSSVLIDKTVDKFRERFPDVKITAIHSGNSPSKVIGGIINHMKGAETNDAGEALVITHAALERLPASIRQSFAKRYHLIVDEVPSATGCMTYDDLPCDVRSAYRYRSCGAKYSRVQAVNPYLWRRVLKSKTRSDRLLEYKDLAEALLNPHREVYALTAQLVAASNGTGEQISFYTKLKPSILEGFGSESTIMSARLEDTLLFRMWTHDGVQFQPHTSIQKDVRATAHENGSLLTIYYAVEADWSMRMRDKPAYAGALHSVQEAIRDAAVQMFGKDHVYMVNKDSEHLMVNTGTQLPNTPHGLNHYQEFDNAVVYSALNLKPPHIAFLDAMAQITSDEIRTAITYQSTYQAALRISLRDIDSQTPKNIVVQDRGCAEYIAKMFPGCRIEKLDAKIDVKKGRQNTKGRARDVTDADRKAAYREEQKLRQLIGVELVNGLAPKVSHNTKGTQDLWDTSGAASPRIGMSVFADIYTPTPIDEIPWEGADAFINGLASFAGITYESKKDNLLISPSIFDPKLAVAAGATNEHGKPMTRGRVNVVSAIGVWMDNDGGGISAQRFIDLFPDLRIVIYNSYSSTVADPRWRAFIPTTHAMTAELYMVIMKQIMRVVEQADTGYRSKLWLCNWIKKWMKDHDGQEPSSVPYKCHGFDLSKMYPENLMYLPSQAGAGPDASFFHDHNDGRRESLDVLNWIEYNIINDTPEAEREYIPVEVVVEPRPEIPAHVRDPKLIRMYEAIQAQYDANAATQKAQRVAAALEIARYAGAEQGDNAFFHCGLALRNAGLSLDEVKAHLDNEARGAASPADRKSQNKRIIDWLRKNAGKTVMSI